MYSNFTQPEYNSQVKRSAPYAMDAIKALGVLFSHKNGACHRVVFLPLVFQFCCKSVFSLIPNKKGERTAIESENALVYDMV